jgi:hypothetical protein
MKKMTTVAAVCLAGLLVFAFTSAARPDEKEVTIKGEAKCAKCSLKEADKCQTVIVVERKNGKKQNYYVVQNDTAKEFHSNVCKESKKVTAKGTVKKTDDGRMEMTVSKIEVDKEKGEKEKE